MKKIIVHIIIASFFFSCKQKAEVFEAKDNDVTIQMVKLNSQMDTGGLSFRARIILDKTAIADQTYQQKTDMMYRMDSCFYLQAGGDKIYAGLVQSVANGASGIYEYMIDFDGNRSAGEKLVLIYQDKYLNRKKYNLKLKEN